MLAASEDDGSWTTSSTATSQVYPATFGEADTCLRYGYSSVAKETCDLLLRSEYLVDLEPWLD